MELISFNTLPKDRQEVYIAKYGTPEAAANHIKMVVTMAAAIRARKKASN
jgi:hypothetical protein